jgi:leucyl aminopeptidase (aminopeptidase T)
MRSCLKQNRLIRRTSGFPLLIAALIATGCSKGARETGSVRDTGSGSDLTASEASPDRDDGLGERNYKLVALKVVTQSARVKEGDVVLIDGTDADLPLLEELSLEVRKQGGFPLVTVASTRLNRRTFDEVPAKYDSVTPKQFLKLVSFVDVFFGTESFDPMTLKGVPPERIAARGKSFNPVTALMQKRGVRSVFLGNGLYPSASNSQEYDVSRRDLADALFSGVDVDNAQLQRTGDAMRQALEAGKEVRITAPNGTDLRMQVRGRPVLVSDGIISPEDQRRGGAATSVWLPAGDVILVPVLGTAEGVLVADRDSYQGEPIEDLRLEFKRGKVVSMSAKSGLEGLKQEYDVAPQGKDVLGVLDFGINSSLKLPAGKPVHAWSRAGMVTVGVGNNVWAGGNNNVPFGMAPFLPNATVTIDGKPLIQDGKLQGGERMAAR